MSSAAQCVSQDVVVCVRGRNRSAHMFTCRRVLGHASCSGLRVGELRGIIFVVTDAGVSEQINVVTYGWDPGCILVAPYEDSVVRWTVQRLRKLET